MEKTTPAVALSLLIIMLSLANESRGSTLEGPPRRFHQRSLCNTFGGCGVARSLPVSGKDYKFNTLGHRAQLQRKLQLAPPYMSGNLQSSARAAGLQPPKGLKPDQIKQHQLMGMAIHQPRVGRYVGDNQVKYSLAY